MIFKYKFCLWLIDTLSIQPLTLPEIWRTRKKTAKFG